AHVLRPRETVIPDGGDEPPRGRAVRDLVCRRARNAGDARRSRPGALLRAAVRRAPRLARHAPRPRPRRGRAGGDRRGRLRRGRTPEARGRGPAPRLGASYFTRVTSKWYVLKPIGAVVFAGALSETSSQIVVGSDTLSQSVPSNRDTCSGLSFVVAA